MTLADALGVDLESLRDRELAPVEVAVLDTGIDATHPALAGRVVEAFRIVEERGRHRAAVCTVPENNDAYGHGTGVASVIAAVAPNARIVDVQVVAAETLELGEALVAGFQLGLLRRFPVLNLSLACNPGLLAPLTELCESAHWQNQLVVAARRNMPLLDHGIPARLSSCIGVDSDGFGSAYEFRFRGRHPVEWIASGEDVTVAAPNGKYTLQTGTSYAAPAIAGACALLLGAWPDLTPFEVRSVLKAMSKD